MRIALGFALTAALRARVSPTGREWNLRQQWEKEHEQEQEQEQESEREGALLHTDRVPLVETQNVAGSKRNLGLQIGDLFAAQLDAALFNEAARFSPRFR